MTYKFNDKETFAFLENEAIGGRLGYESFPPAEYKYFSQLAKLGWLNRHKGWAAELCELVGLDSPYDFATRLRKSADGYLMSKNKKYRYARMNPVTGEIYVGGLPKEVIDYLWRECYRRKLRGRRPRKVVLRKGREELVFGSVKEAQHLTGVNRSTIYRAINNGYYAGGYWSYKHPEK